MPCAPILGNREHYRPTQGSVCLNLEWNRGRTVEISSSRQISVGAQKDTEKLSEIFKTLQIKQKKGEKEEIRSYKSSKRYWVSMEKRSRALFYTDCWASTVQLTGQQRHTLTSTFAMQGCVSQAPEGLWPHTHSHPLTRATEHDWPDPSTTLIPSVHETWPV